LEKFYLYVAIPASLILIVQTLMTILGASGEIDVDFDGDGDVDMTGETGITLFSVRNLIAFFTFFGWSGLWMRSVGMNPVVTAILSILVGVIFAAISMSLFFLISKMQRNGSMNLTHAIGNIGDVYIPIPPNRQSYGKIMIVIQGALREVEAVTDEQAELVTGTQVRVISVASESKLLVKKLEL